MLAYKDFSAGGYCRTISHKDGYLAKFTGYWGSPKVEEFGTLTELRLWVTNMQARAYKERSEHRRKLGLDDNTK